MIYTTRKKLRNYLQTYGTLKPKVDSTTKCVYSHPLVCHHCNLQQLNLLFDYQDTTTNIRSPTQYTSYKVILYNIVVLKSLDFFFSFWQSYCLTKKLYKNHYYPMPFIIYEDFKSIMMMLIYF